MKKIKFYNKTKCPNELLRPLLVAAGKSVGVRTSEVVVKVTQGRYAHSHGEAVECNLVHTWHLKRYKHRRAEYDIRPGRLITSDGGWIRITLPGTSCHSFRIAKNDIQYVSFLTQAEGFYETAQHEWAHINDFQKGRRRELSSPRGPSGRRVAWGDRPLEISAIDQVGDAKRVSKQDEYILDLALWLEEQYHTKKGV